MKSRLHGGWKGMLFNTFFVGAFNALPRSLVRRFGWHLLAFCRNDRRLRSSRRTPSATISSWRRRGRSRDVSDLAGVRARGVRSASRHRRRRTDRLFERRRTGHPCGCCNADGSRSEVSGNGVRCLGAWIASQRGAAMPGQQAPIDDRHRRRHQAAGATRVRGRALHVPGRDGSARARRAGAHRRWTGERSRRSRCASAIPSASSSARSRRSGSATLAAALAVHPHFPEGTNVELAAVEAADRVRILIWERGVGRPRRRERARAPPRWRRCSSAAPRATCRSCRRAARSASSGPTTVSS